MDPSSDEMSNSEQKVSFLASVVFDTHNELISHARSTAKPFWEEHRLLVDAIDGSVGSICSKRLQDRIEFEFPEEYNTVVNDMYGRSWDKFIDEKTQLECFLYTSVSEEWLIAPGSLRIRRRSESAAVVDGADRLMSLFVCQCCSEDLDRLCSMCIMGVFVHTDWDSYAQRHSAAMEAACTNHTDGHNAEGTRALSVMDARRQLQLAIHSEEEMEDSYRIGSLSLWRPLLWLLWVRPSEGAWVYLRDLDRLIHQLGAYVRLLGEWTELLGNGLLFRYVRQSVLRILLNKEKPPMQSAAGSRPNAINRGTLTVRRGEREEWCIFLHRTEHWGKVPPLMLQQPFRRRGRGRGVNRE